MRASDNGTGKAPRARTRRAAPAAAQGHLIVSSAPHGRGAAPALRRHGWGSEHVSRTPPVVVFGGEDSGSAGPDVSTPGGEPPGLEKVALDLDSDALTGFGSHADSPPACR